MKRVTSSDEMIKRIASDTSSEVHVGMDAHKNSISVAIWCREQIVTHWRMPASAEQLINKLGPLLALRTTLVYEAGPTGYGLARRLRAAGFTAEVIAPSYTPVLPGQRSKTDRLDSMRLAQMSAKGLLRIVAVPSEEEEADRQLVRMRQALRQERTRTKARIKSFLLMHSIAEPAGLKDFTLASVARLRQLELVVPLRQSLDLLLDRLEFDRRQLVAVNRQIAALCKAPRHASGVARLRTHPGVGPVVSAEVWGPQRFAHVDAVARYIGLSPTQRQSGETSHGGPISRTGRPELRRLLVEAAWSWIKYDRQAFEVYKRLLVNTGEARKAIVAMARRLAQHLWCMLVREEVFHPAPAMAA